MVRVDLRSTRQKIIKYRLQQMMCQPKEKLSYLKSTNLVNG